MLQRIEQKLNELKYVYPSNPEYRNWMMQSDLWNWIYNIMILDGEKVHKTAVAQMVQGELNEDIPLWRYGFAQNIREIYCDMDQYIAMDTDLEYQMICKWARLLLNIPSGISDADVLRHNHTVVYEWDLIPAEESRVYDIFLLLLKEYKLKEHKSLSDAARLHLEINRLYPFGENSVLMSMIILMYCLKSFGYPLPVFSVNDIEYNKIMVGYVENGDIEPFLGMLERSVYNRIDNAVTLAAQANTQIT